MVSNMLFDALKEIKEKERKKPMRINLDEKTGQIKEEPLLDSAGSLFYKNQAKEIHDYLFGSRSAPNFD